MNRAALRAARATAILFVACMMAAPLAEIDWNDPTEYAPAVVTALSMPLTYSIATGIGLGVITYIAVKLLSARFRQVSPAVVLIGAVFVLHFALTRGACPERHERNANQKLLQRTQNACGLGGNWADLLRKDCAQVWGGTRYQAPQRRQAVAKTESHTNSMRGDAGVNNRSGDRR